MHKLIAYIDKLMLSHYTPRRRLGKRRYSSYSLTSALYGGEWAASRPGRALPPRKGPPIPIVQEAGCVPKPVWKQRIEETSSCLCRGLNLDRPVVQPVARHYTDWATPAHTYIDKCRYEIQRKKKSRYGIPAYTGPFRALSAFKHNAQRNIRTLERL
jgi:hypothetical protein